MSRTFSINSGSRDSLKVSLRWGSRAKARQIRLMALWLIPQRRAINRVLQCVALEGVDSRVRVITRSTCASLTWRGAPARGSSRSPSSRWVTKRLRHFPTAGRLSFSSALTTVLVFSCAQASTTRARCARACADFGRRAHRSKVSRSSLLSFKIGSGRPLRIVVLLYTSDAWTRHLVILFITQDTRCYLPKAANNPCGSFLFLLAVLASKMLPESPLF